MRRQHLAAFHNGIELAALLLETAPALLDARSSATATDSTITTAVRRRLYLMPRRYSDQCILFSCPDA